MEGPPLRDGIRDETIWKISAGEVPIFRRRSLGPRLASLDSRPGEAATPPELRFAFSQLLELFHGQSFKPEVLSELFWASLHGIAELTRTKRFPHSRQKERVRALVERFTFPR